MAPNGPRAMSALCPLLRDERKCLERPRKSSLTLSRHGRFIRQGLPRDLIVAGVRAMVTAKAPEKIGDVNYFEAFGCWLDARSERHPLPRLFALPAVKFVRISRWPHTYWREAVSDRHYGSTQGKQVRSGKSGRRQADALQAPVCRNRPANVCARRDPGRSC
jgi:hypothetical protein